MGVRELTLAFEITRGKSGFLQPSKIVLLAIKFFCNRWKLCSHERKTSFYSNFKTVRQAYGTLVNPRRTIQITAEFLFSNRNEPGHSESSNQLTSIILSQDKQKTFTIYRGTTPSQLGLKQRLL